MDERPDHTPDLRVRSEPAAEPAVLFDDAVLDVRIIRGLDLSTRAENVLLNNFLGKPVGEVWRVMAARRDPGIPNCGVVTKGEIQTALFGFTTNTPTVDEAIARIHLQARMALAEVIRETRERLDALSRRAMKLGDEDE
jgi:hypothetical protein